MAFGVAYAWLVEVEHSLVIGLNTFNLFMGMGGGKKKTHNPSLLASSSCLLKGTRMAATRFPKSDKADLIAYQASHVLR